MKLFLKIFIPCVLGIPGLPGTSQSTGKPPKGHGNGFGLPGEKQIQDSKIYTDLDKEAIFNRYATAKKVPFQWSRERKIKFVQEQIGINNNGELTGELIVELEEKLKKMPILQGDVPSLSPSSMIAFGGKPPPIWLPDPEFGRDRGAPGTEEINGPSEYNIGPPSMNPSPKAEISKKQKVINFINKFGYIEQSLDKAYPKEVKFSDKIKEIQEQYGLSQTGSLDDKLIEEISKPRCGKKDSPSGIRAPSGYKINDGRHKWDGGNKLITWSQAGYSNDLPPEIQVDAMRRAFQVWSNVADIKFEYKGNDDPDADIQAYFGYQMHGDAWGFDGANGLLAHAFYPDPAYANLMGDMHFDEDEFWTLGEGKIVRAIDPSSDKIQYCHFPFNYKGVEYKTCIPHERQANYQWCSTELDYVQDKTSWGYCATPSLFTYGGNAKGENCHFPFTFQGTSYDTCTTDGRNDGYAWCSPDPSFETNNRYGFCPRDASGTFGGNGAGAPCIFPFVFQGNSYNSCTTIGRNDNYLWCATTSNFDTDSLFGFCDGVFAEYSFFQVAAHEAGHAIGLDHSNDPSALMYPSYQGYVKDYKLPYDDTRAAQDLYGARTTPTPEPTNKPTTKPTKPEPTITTMVTPEPPTDCEWTYWSDWGPCDPKCSQNRFRTCDCEPRIEKLENLDIFRSNVSSPRKVGEVKTKSQCRGDNEESQTCKNLSCGEFEVTTAFETTKTTAETVTDVSTGYSSSLCSGGYDAILQYSRETYVFQDEYVWRIEGENHYDDGDWMLKGPEKISQYWAALPSRIDAAYRVPELPGISWGTGNLRFFSGSQYWEYSGSNLVAGFPKSISTLGIPTTTRFSAALNKRKGKGANFRRLTQLFSGSKFYTFDEKTKRFTRRGRAQDIAKLHIIGSPNGNRISAAMEGNDDERSFYFYDNIYLAQDDSSTRFYAGDINSDFFHCCKENQGSVINNVYVIKGNGICETSDPDCNDYSSIDSESDDCPVLRSGNKSAYKSSNKSSNRSKYQVNSLSKL